MSKCHELQELETKAKVCTDETPQPKCCLSLRETRTRTPRGGTCTPARSPRRWEPTLANCISQAENQQLFDIWAAERAPPSSHKSAGGWNILRPSNSHPSQTYPTRVHTPKHTSRLKQRGGVPASPVCTDQSARAIKGRCVPQRWVPKQTERYACIWRRSPSSRDAQPAGQGGSSGVTLARPDRGGAPSVLPNSEGHPRGTSVVAPAAGELRRSRPALRPARSPPGAHPREPHEAARAPAGRSCVRGGSPPPWTPACGGHAETRSTCRRAWRPTLFLWLP